MNDPSDRRKRCLPDLIGRLVIAAVKIVSLAVPLVLRLKGANVEEGKCVVWEFRLNVLPVGDFDDVAQEIVAVLNGRV